MLMKVATEGVGAGRWLLLIRSRRSPATSARRSGVGAATRPGMVPGGQAAPRQAVTSPPREERHMRFAMIALTVLMGAGTAYAQENEAHEKAEAAEAAKSAPALAAAMKEAKVSLASGLKAAEKE